MAASVGWTGGVLVAASVSGYWPSRIAVNVVLISTAVSSAAFLAFTLEYTGQERYLKWPYPLAFAAEPALVALLTFTNEFHGLFWRAVYPDPVHYSGYTHVWYVGQWFHVGFTYLVTAAGTVLLVRKLLRSRAIHRSQTAAVLVAALAPVVGNVLYVTEIYPLGQIVGFGVTGVALYWAIVRGRLGDLSPVARATVLEELEMGVIVVDDEGRITDSNPYAMDLLDVDDAGAVIGSSLSAVLEDRGDLIERYGDRARVEDTITVLIDGEQRQLSLKVSALTDNLDREVGTLILFEDVTERRRRREEIERQNERLQEFASMVSHDLRNPLDVASGYVELMRQSRTADTGGTHLEADKLDETADALGRIEAIVDDVLTLAREGEAATDPETVSLRSAARAAWDHVDTADARVVIGTDAMVVADRDQLVRLFENLFRNAVEHGSTSPGSRARQNSVEHGGDGVTVSVGTMGDGELAGFYVEDDGRGIPEDVQDGIFESGVTTGEDGTGFGLAIVDQLANAHDWTVVVTDSEEGGARFEFTGVTFTTENVPLEASAEH